MNIFEYRPELQYILDDIDSINNLPSGNLDAIRTYILNNTASTINKSSNVKESIENILSLIKASIKDLSIPYTKDIDEILPYIIGTGANQSKLLNDKVLTYNLYTKLKNTPRAEIIVNEWENYSAGLYGSLEAELELVAEEIMDTLNYIDKVVDSTLLYNIEDTQNLRQSELLQLEDYMRLLDSLQDLTASGNVNEYNLTKRRINEIEQRLTFKRNLSVTINSVLSSLSDITQDIYDGVVPEFKSIYEDTLSNGLSEFKRLTSIDELKTKTFIYMAYKDSYEGYIQMLQNQKNLISPAIKESSANNLIRYSRMYLDVVVPEMGIILDSNYNAAMETVAGEVITGMEAVTRQYDKSMLDFRNILNADVSKIRNRIEAIYAKHKNRTMYRQLTN